jgi:hypothetical protein
MDVKVGVNIGVNMYVNMCKQAIFYSQQNAPTNLLLLTKFKVIF